MQALRRWEPIGGLLFAAVVAAWWLTGLDAGGEAVEVVRPAAAAGDGVDVPVVDGVAVQRLDVDPHEATIDEDEIARSGDVSPESGSLLVRILWSDGSPAADVGFVLMQWARPNPYLHAIRQRVDAAGEYLAESATPGKVTLYGDRGGSEPGLVTAGERTVLELTLPPGRRVEGRVVDEREAPVSGADVWLSAPANHTEGQIVTRTDAAGRFRIEAVGSHHHVGARHPSYQPSALTELDDSSDESVLLVLRDGGARLRGWVGDADGEPIAGASVLVGAVAKWEVAAPSPGTGPPPVPALTGPDGTFALDGLPAGTGSVEAHAPGHAAASEMVTLHAGGVTDVTLALGRGCVVTGTVSDSNGQAIALAAITSGDFVNFRGSWAFTDDAGHYRLPDLPAGTLYLTAEHRDYMLTSTRLPVAFGVEAEWNPVLSSGLSIEGVVVDRREGTPLAGWVVVAKSVAKLADEGYVAWTDSARTDADGRFSVSGLVDEDYRLDVHDAEHFTAIPDAIVESVRPGGPPVRIVVEDALVARGGITGRVIDQTGAIVRDGWVRMAPAGQKAITGVRIDGDDGRFLMEHLAPGSYAVEPFVKGATTRAIEAVVQSEMVTDVGDLRIISGGVVVVRVGPEPGIDLSDVYIDVTSVATGRGVRTQHEGDVYRSDPTPAGTYEIEVRGTSAAAQRVTAEVEAGAERHMELPLVAGVSLLLRYDWPDRESHPREVTVTITDGEGHIRFVARARGAPDRDPVHVLALEPGAYTLQVTDLARPHPPTPFDVIAGPRQVVTIDMR